MEVKHFEDSEKIDAFKTVLPYIHSKDIRNFAEKAITKLPDYFFIVPASSTGKYHPEYSLGEGGLLRHTLSAIRIAVELMRLDWWHFTPEQKDLIFVSLILHDGWKYGNELVEYTISNHAVFAGDKLYSDEELTTLIDDESFFQIVSNINSHMGQWNKDYKTDQEVAPKPVTKTEKFVHLCDYLASRKCLIMDFTVPVPPV